MDPPKLKKSKVDFILVAVRGDGEELTKRIARLVALAEEYGASAEATAGIVLVTYGALADEEKGDQQPRGLLDALERSFPSDVKILYGAEVGHSGFMVGREHLAYNILLPHLTKARHRLHDLSWGEVFEFNPKETNA